MTEFEEPSRSVQTARLELRILQESHLNDFHAIWVNPTATIWTTRGVSHSLEDSNARMAGLLPNPEKPESLNFGAFIQFSSDMPSTSVSGATASGFDRMVGVVGVFNASSPGTAEVGYIYHESFWGRGYASEALAAYVNAYWSHIKKINIMVVKVDPENAPSIKVLRKCGFIEVEHIVGNIVLPALGRRDTLVFRKERPRATC